MITNDKFLIPKKVRMLVVEGVWVGRQCWVEGLLVVINVSCKTGKNRLVSFRRTR